MENTGSDHKNKILIVEDDRGMRDFLEILLEREGYEIYTAKDGEEGIRAVQNGKFDLVLADIQMPKASGMEVLKEVRSVSPDTAVIMITAFGTIESSVEAMKLGAFDYITKPFVNEDIKLRIRKAFEIKKLKEENVQLKSELEKKYHFKNLIGRSRKMQPVFDLMEKVSKLAESAIIITGESGTGKELVARAIHYNGPRKDKPFVPINCGALPETLLESELFGHVKGAFTGAFSDKPGLLEIANGGTVFLDEISETSQAMQVKLLRFLQDKTFRRVGGLRDIRVDVQVMAATNKDLEKLVKDGLFRDDLFYRLNVIQIKLPPLRERVEDIPLLAEHFVKKFCKKYKKEEMKISSEAMDILCGYYWPGNVRQLENVIERAIALESGNVITKDSLPANLLSPPQIGEFYITSIPDAGVDLQKLLDDFERALIIKAMEKVKWVKKDAAQLLGISFRSMRYRISKLGIDKDNMI